MANITAPLLLTSGTAAFRTTGAIWVGALLRRISAYEINVGQGASAYNSVDSSAVWDVSRFGATNGIAGTAVIPNLLDPADGSPASQFMNTTTADPTYTTAGNGLNLYTWPVNQRGFNRWRALDDGDNIIVPATAGFGIGVRALMSGGALTTLSCQGTLAAVER
jgi:hypothetical protein